MDEPGEAAALTSDIGFLLSRASGVVARVSNAALIPHGLRVRSYSVLMLACDRVDGITQRELADVLGLDPSQVVLLVDELAAAELVERRPSTSDRRTKLVCATDRGRAVCRSAVPDVAAGHDQRLADLSAGERQLLRELLASIVFPRAGRA